MSTRLNKLARGPIDHTCTILKRDIRKLSHQPVSLRPQFQCTCYQLTSCILNKAQGWAGGGGGWVGGDMSIAVGWGRSFDHFTQYLHANLTRNPETRDGDEILTVHHGRKESSSIFSVIRWLENIAGKEPSRTKLMWRKEQFSVTLQLTFRICPGFQKRQMRALPHEKKVNFFSK